MNTLTLFGEGGAAGGPYAALNGSATEDFVAEYLTAAGDFEVAGVAYLQGDTFFGVGAVIEVGTGATFSVVAGAAFYIDTGTTSGELFNNNTGIFFNEYGYANSAVFSDTADTASYATEATYAIGALGAVFDGGDLIAIAGLGTPSAGARAVVSDALAPTFGAAVAAGGSVKVPVYYDGTTWRVG